jgi:adenylate cyclase
MVQADGDLLGDSVNIAARLETIAEPGGVCISEDAYRQVRDRLKEEFVDLGDKQLKNIARPVQVFAINMGPSNPTAVNQVAISAKLQGQRKAR